MIDCLRMGWNVTRAKKRQIDDIGNCIMRTEEHSLRSQVGMGSESHACWDN